MLCCAVVSSPISINRYLLQPTEYEADKSVKWNINPRALTPTLELWVHTVQRYEFRVLRCELRRVKSYLRWSELLVKMKIGVGMQVGSYDQMKMMNIAMEND